MENFPTTGVDPLCNHYPVEPLLDTSTTKLSVHHNPTRTSLNSKKIKSKNNGSADIPLLGEPQLQPQSHHNPRRSSPKMNKSPSIPSRSVLKLGSSSTDSFIGKQLASRRIVNQSKVQTPRSSELIGDTKDEGEVTKNLEDEQVEERLNSGQKKSTENWGFGVVREPRSTKGIQSENIPKTKPTNNKEKPIEFSISLSRSEIEEDMYALTGSRLSRKPKRRSKEVQEIVNRLSPGFSLCSITSRSYNQKG